LILDEPTNHLDIETVRWLEDFLRDDPRAALVVSHDRYFLDRVANEVWELDGGELTLYPDLPRDRAYSAYVTEKATRRELAEREYERFREEEKRRKAVVAELRTHGSHNYSHVRSREKQLAKMDRVEAPKTSQQTISVKLEAARRATNGLALQVRDVAAAYDKTLFEHLSFSVARGERIAVVGPNGAGKSTLLAILADRRSPDHGSVKISEGIRTAYFSQDSADELPAGARAVDAVLEGSTILPEEGRSLLGRLGLSGDAGDKPVEAFSGGERRRIMLARLMARSADCLFLDEPTNDLDIPSREGLEEVLASYGGAMIVVSHDRYLLQRLADKVLWIRGGVATLLDGGYEEFEELQRPASAAPDAKTKSQPKTQAKVESKASAPKSPLANGRDERVRREREAKDLAATEREVARLDAERARLEGEFADPAIYDDRDRVATLQRELAEIATKAEAALERWERLSSAVAETASP
jgi:ATP-binding cassette subfamily F protein 3